MKKLRKLSIAVVLTLALGTYAMAGTIETPPAPDSTASSVAASLVVVLVQSVLR